MASPIIKYVDWNVNETKCSLMKGSRVGNAAISNSVTKQIIELETPSFVTKYSVDDKYGPKIKIHSDEVNFDKFVEFEQFVNDMEKSTLFLTENKKKSIYCPMISEDCAFINFSIYLEELDKLEVVDKDNIIQLYKDVESLKLLLPKKSKIICFIKFQYLYNNHGKYGVKKIITKIKKLE